MSNLVQKSITDKNGVISRRWVKNDTNTPKKSKVPAPEVGGKPQSASDTAPLFKTIHSGSQLGHTLIGLDEFDPRAVKAIEDLLASTESKSVLHAYASRAIKAALKDVADNLFGQESEYDFDDPNAYTPINNLAVFGDVIFHDDSGMTAECALINGLIQFPLISDYLLEADEEEVKKARALVLVAGQLREPFTTTVYAGEPEDESDSWDDDADPRDDKTFITSKELSDYIMANPDKANEIVAVVQDRNTSDVDVIQGVIGHEQPSLRDGWL